MAKIIVLIVIIFLAVMGVLAYFNSGTVELTVWKDVTHPIPVVALILASTAVGILTMFVIYAIRDARRYYDVWQIQRQNKKEAKVQDSYSKGVEAFHAARLENSRELFTGVIESVPNHANALLRIGDIALKENDFAGAKDYYMRALEVKPRSIEVLLSLVNTADAQQKWQESLKHLNTILEIDDENKAVLQRKRSLLEQRKNWEELIELQGKVLKTKLVPEEEARENVRMTGYKCELGRSYIGSGDVDKAIKSLKAVIKHDDKFTSAYLAVSDAYKKDGNAKEAENILLKGYETTQSMVILAVLEDHYISEGEPGTIIEIYQQALQKNPKDAKLRFLLAKLYYRLEMIDHVMDTINAVDPVALDFKEVHMLLGSVYERRAENEKALEEYRKALKADQPMVVPYSCTSCSYTSMEWSGCCPECNSWNSFILDINETRDNSTRQISS